MKEFIYFISTLLTAFLLSISTEAAYKLGYYEAVVFLNLTFNVYVLLAIIASPFVLIYLLIQSIKHKEKL